MNAGSRDSAGVVVIGAGLAGAHVLGGLRDGGYSGPLTLVGDESELPYERPPLSKDVLAGLKEADSAYVHDADWYAERDIVLHLDDAAVDLDRDQRQIRLASGRLLPYSKLVLATGASPRTVAIPGGEFGGVHTLRTIADCLTLRSSFDGARHLVVVGAGWIGLEVASAAKQAGLNVVVLESASAPLLAVMGPQLSGYFAALHERNGVDLRTGVCVEAIEGADGKVTGVRVGGEVEPADLVLIGVGVVPNTELAEKAGIETDDGILVDDTLRSSDPGIFAIGDVANAYNTAVGARVRVAHWDNAVRQGELVAKVILGGNESYDWQPYFYTDQFDLGMEYVGQSAPSDDVVIRGEQDTGEFVAFWLRDGVITAAMNVNVWDVSDDLRATIGKRIEISRLTDTSIQTSELAS